MKDFRTYCGADCSVCPAKDECPGCVATSGCPFGGTCIAAEYIKAGGKNKYLEFKKKTLEEVNGVLESLDIGKAEELFELSGQFVNLEYPLPSGEKVKFLDDRKIYLGCQIEKEGIGVCYGVVAGMDFILVCSYSDGGSEAELVEFRRR